MVNVNQTGTYAATVGSETTIVDLTANKHYDIEIDCSLLQSGESLEIRLKKKVLTGGSLLVKEKTTVAFPTTDKEIWALNWEPSAYNLRVTGKQVGGTTRNFDFIVYDS